VRIPRKEVAMTRALPLIAALVLAAPAPAARAADRAKADVACRPSGEVLQYDCTIKLTNARTGAALTEVALTVGADMPSMPGMHNVPPATATPADEAGTYHVLLELEMHGDWALQLNLAGPLRDRLIKRLRFEDGRVIDTPRPTAPLQRRN
jgi:hypothetical protein